MGCIIFDINGGGKIARPRLFKEKTTQAEIERFSTKNEK